MRKLATDRRLWLTAEKDQVVEEGDVRAAFLLAAAGREIPAAEVERLGLKVAEGRIVYPAGPELEELGEGRPVVTDTGVIEGEAGKVLRFGGEGEEAPDDSDRNNEEPLEWPGRTSPEAYLKRYPTGPKSELARAVLAARDDGADGGS